MRRLGTRIVIIGLAATLIIALLGLSGSLSRLQEGLRWLTLPVVRFFADMGNGLGDRLRPSPDRENLEVSMKELEARLSALVVDYVRLRALEEENRSLRTLMGFVDESGYDYVSARVISRTRDPRRALVVIDRGARDGLETGMAVVIGKGIYAGKVTHLQETISTITLVTDEQSRTAASLPGQHRLIGLVEGGGNDLARLTFVPQQENVRPQDVIVTAGTEEKIPSNLIIGMIDEVEGRPSDPFKQASLVPSSNSDQLDIVAVLRSRALRPTNELLDKK